MSSHSTYCHYKTATRARSRNTCRKDQGRLRGKDSKAKEGSREHAHPRARQPLNRLRQGWRAGQSAGVGENAGTASTPRTGADSATRSRALVSEGMKKQGKANIYLGRVKGRLRVNILISGDTQCVFH